MPALEQVSDDPPPAVPVSKSVLNVLSKLRNTLEADERRAVVAELLEALPSPLHKHDAAVSYCMRRLALGASVSAGGSRANMSLALAAIAHAMGPKGPAAAVAAVTSVYGSGGSFVCDYSGAERERALGALAAGAAAARAVRVRGPGAIELSAARALVAVLRASAACKWALGVPCAVAARDLLDGIDADARPALARTLLAWCRDRVKSSDAAALALLMLVDSDAISTDQFCDVYPRPEALRSALHDCFQTGFPLWRRGDDSHVPIQWALALRLAGTGGAKKALGDVGVQAFWQNFVVSGLCRPAGGPEKSALALLLFPDAIRACSGPDSFLGLLRDEFADLLRYLVRRYMGRKRKNDGPAAERLCDLLLDFGRSAVAALREKQRQGVKNVGVWVRELVLWTMAQRLGSKLFRSDCMQVLATLLTESDCDALVRSSVTLFAQPQCTPREVGAVRCAVVHFMVDLAAQRPKLAHDIGTFLTLYSVFDCAGEFDAAELGSHRHGDKGESNESAKETVLELKAFHRHISKDSRQAVNATLTFAGVAPAPAPEVSPEVKHVMFKLLVDVVLHSYRSSMRSTASHVNVKGTDGWTTSIVDFARLLDDEREKRLVTLNVEFAELRPAMVAVKDALQSVPDELAPHPVVQSIHVWIRFMELLMYEPSVREADEDIGVTRATYTRVLSQAQSCIKSLIDESSRAKEESENQVNLEPAHNASIGEKKHTESSDSENDSNERQPTAMEQLVFILAMLCRQHSSAMRQIACFAFEIVAEVADTSVAAVLFDLLEADGTEPAGDRSDSEEVDDVSRDQDERDSDAEASDDKENPHSQKIELDEGGKTAETPSQGSEASSEDEDVGPGLATRASGRDAHDADDDADSIEDQEAEDDLMVEDEDPEVLLRYDQHLARHMQLLKVEKKQNRRKRRSSAMRAMGAGRILDLVEVLARRLRLSLETRGDVGASCVVTFADLVTRFVECSYGPYSQGATDGARLGGIFAKHLDRPLSSFGDGLLAEEEGIVLLSRCFDAVRAAEIERKPSVMEVRMLAHAYTILYHASPRSAVISSLVRTGYKDLWEKFCSPRSRLIGVSVFTSAAARIPSILCELCELAVQTAMDPKATRGTRKLSLEILHAYVPTVRERSAVEGVDVPRKFWLTVKRLFDGGAAGSDSKDSQLWKHGVNIEFLLRLLDAGLRSGDLAEYVEVGPAVKTFLSRLSAPRSVEVSWRKTLNSIYLVSPVSESAQLETSTPSSGDDPAVTKTLSRGQMLARRKAKKAKLAGPRMEPS